MKRKVFWSDKAHIYHHKSDVKFRDGIYFRSFDLNKFMKLVEKEEGEVVGFEFEDNNVNIIIKEHEQKKKAEQQESKIYGQKPVKGKTNKKERINV